MNVPTHAARCGSSPVSIGEASFADVINAIQADAKLGEQDKRFWPTSLRQMAKYLGMPLSLLPARITGIGPKISRLHPERIGANPKTFANHRANVRKALNWYQDSNAIIGRRAPMTEPYRQLLKQIQNRHHRDVVAPFFRYLTMEGVKPEAIDDAHIVGDLRP